MASSLNWAILGTGSIAEKFAEGLPLCQHGKLVAVGSRNADSAEAFVAKHAGQAYGSYEEAIADPQVEAVYIALPHHLHAEWTIKAAKAGKHILCEKPFAMNLAQAREAIAAVKEAGVFFMEAFMYRCHPQTILLKQLLNDGVIGRVMVVTGEFCYATQRPGKHFRVDPALGGGALMDVGCYPVSMIRLIAGQEPKRVVYSAELTPEGYDGYGSGLMDFENGVRATFNASVHCNGRNWVTINGENGTITVTDPWFCNGQLVVQINGRAPEEMRYKKPPHLWGNQSIVAAQLLERKQAPFMSWDDTLGNMRILDLMRQSAGIRWDVDE